MNINTTIYGAPETWYTPAEDYGSKPATKLPTWGTGYYNHYYFGGFDVGTFTANGAPVDNSLALWGINKNAPFARPYFFFPTLAVDGNYEYTTDPEAHTLNVLSAEDSTIPMTAAVYGSGLSIRANSLPENQYTPNAATPLSWYQAACLPILDFKYNNIVLCPYIIAARDTEGSDDSGLDFTTYSITDYFDNGGQADYPYIVAVNADVFIASTSVSPRSKNNDALKLWYSTEYASHISSWGGTFTKYLAPYYSVQPAQTIRVSGGYHNSADSSVNFSFSSNESFTTVPEAFARFTRIGDTDTLGIILDNGKYDYKIIPNRGYCTITSIWANATKDEVLQEVAYLGYWFADDETTAINAANGRSCTSDKMHIPVFDTNGITTGDYLSGTDAAAAAPADEETARGIAPDYDPNAGGDVPEGDSGDLSNVGAPRNPNLFGELTFYAMTPTEYYNFIKALNNYYIGKTPDDWTLDFQGVNPSEYILNCYYTWFDLPTNDTELPINIGSITLPDVTARKLQEGDTMLRPNRWQYCDFGVRQIAPVYGDFRDLSPYTEIELYLPLAGTVELETAYVMGHNISVRYYYNLLTMTGVACVYRDDMLYKTADLQIASQIPLLSTNIGQYQNQIVTLENARKQNAIRLTAGAIATAAGVGATIATGGAALPALAAIGTGAAALTTGVINQDKLDYDISHAAPSLSVTGASEASNNLCTGQLMPKLIIKRAAMLPHNDDIYAHTVGNACCINTTVGAMSGLTVCSNVDVSGISATASEVSAIQNLLASGIYV